MSRPDILDRLRERGLVGRVLADLLGLDAPPRPGATVRCPNRGAHKNADGRPSFVVGRNGEGGMCLGGGCRLVGGLLDLVRVLKGLPDRAAAARWLEETYLAGGAPPRPNTKTNPEPRPRVTKTTHYEVRDLDSRHVATHVRRDFDDGSKSFAWELPDGTNGLGGLRSPALPLFGAELLKDTPEDVVLTEGEKAAVALRPLGFLALATVTGAGVTPSREVLAALAGRTVHLWPDNDDEGRQHMDRIATILHDLGTKLSVVEWKDAPPKGDAANFIEAGETPEAVERLLAEARPWTTPAREPNQSEPKNQAGASAPIVVCMADVKREAVAFLWEPYIPRGKITIFEGDPGDGKTTLHLAIAAAVTRGWPLPGSDGTPRGAKEPANVLLLTNEDGLADTAGPRLDAAGADSARVFVLAGKETTDAETGRKSVWPVTLADLATIEEAVRRHAPALVVVDPVQGYLGAHVDMHRANQVRPVLAALGALAERYGFALVLVRHLSKADQGRSLYRGLGSIDFAAIARSVLLVGKDPADPARRVAVHVKSSTAQAGPSIAFRIAEHAAGGIRCGRLEWCGTSDLTAADVLAPEGKADGGALADAEVFLRSELAERPREADELLERARGEGIATATLRRAATRLRVVKEKVGFRPSQWTWRLPEDAQGENKSTFGDRAPSEGPKTRRNAEGAHGPEGAQAPGHHAEGAQEPATGAEGAHHEARRAARNREGAQAGSMSAFDGRDDEATGGDDDAEWVEGEEP